MHAPSWQMILLQLAIRTFQTSVKRRDGKGVVEGWTLTASGVKLEGWKPDEVEAYRLQSFRPLQRVLVAIRHVCRHLS